MKHVFSVHSPITFLISYAVIENLKLQKEDVIILTNNYSVPSAKYPAFPFLSSKQRSMFDRVFNMNSPEVEDKYLDSLLKGEKFIAYIDMVSFPQRILITHRGCEKFHFIEEGNSSYREEEDLDTATWEWAYKKVSFRENGSKNLLKNAIQGFKWGIRGYNLRLQNLPYSFKAYGYFNGLKFFGFSDKVFPDTPFDKKEILSIDEKDPEILKMAGGIQLQDCVIWVDGSNSGFTGLDESIYHKAIDKTILKLKNVLTEKKVHIKLRPGIKDYSSNYLYSALTKNNIEVNVMPDKLLLECVFISSSNCTVIGNLSSALFYAQIFGNKSYSIYSLFEKQVPTIFDKMPAYWDKVEKL